MAATDTEAGPVQGDVARSLFLISDLHIEQAHSDSKRRRLRERIVPGWIDHYMDTYDCDRLGVAGDIGDRPDDLDSIRNTATTTPYITPGDEDDWYDPDAPDHGAGSGMDAAVGTALRWKERVPGAPAYTIEMAHEPYHFGLDSPKDGPDDYADWRPDALNDVDIALYGHGHQPYARAIGDTLVIGAGSSYSNYDMVSAFPRRSAHVIDLGPDAVRVRHIDLTAIDMEGAATMDRAEMEAEEVFEDQRFAWADDGLEELDPVHPLRTWPAERFIYG